MNGRLFGFAGGEAGPWRVAQMKVVAGDPLAHVARVNVVQGAQSAAEAAWFLQGVTSNERYVNRSEKERLSAQQPELGRAEATFAALIPIQKTAVWWGLAQDERRSIIEERSNHVKTGLKYLPAVARRLYHCRDLGSEEPFDFLTWFEYAPSDNAAFDELVAALRETEEWTYVDREIDIRLIRDQAGAAAPADLDFMRR
ncbi:MAG: chlorite dismutase family protein [Candidatus Velthaea sp.]